jgi:hypothetical protein
MAALDSKQCHMCNKYVTEFTVFAPKEEKSIKTCNGPVEQGKN